MRASQRFGTWTSGARTGVMTGVMACALAVAALAAVGATTGCEKKAPPEQAKPDGTVGMPNPASVHCIKEDGKLEIRKGPGGGEYGMCVFKDGSECDEWKLFRGECKPGESTGEPQAK